MLPDTCLLGATEKELLHNFRANRGGEKAVVDFTALQHASRDPRRNWTLGLAPVSRDMCGCPLRRKGFVDRLDR